MDDVRHRTVWRFISFACVIFCCVLHALSPCDYSTPVVSPSCQVMLITVHYLAL